VTELSLAASDKFSFEQKAYFCLCLRGWILHHGFSECGVEEGIARNFITNVTTAVDYTSVT
jgi:hypothetical protein